MPQGKNPSQTTLICTFAVILVSHLVCDDKSVTSLLLWQLLMCLSSPQSRFILECLLTGVAVAGPELGRLRGFSV